MRLQYLKFSTLLFEAVVCIRAGDGKLRLVADLSVVCYEGSHGHAAAFAWCVSPRVFSP